MENIKVRQFRGINTNYDSADVNIEYFKEYNNIKTKAGYIIPENIIIKNELNVENIVDIYEVVIDSDKLSNYLSGNTVWATLESNYKQNIISYILLIQKNKISLILNNEVVYNSTLFSDEIVSSKILNYNGIVKLLLNFKEDGTQYFLLQKVSRIKRYFLYKTSYNDFLLTRINNIIYINSLFEVKNYYKTKAAYYDNQILENEIFIPNIKRFINISEEININPFDGIKGNYYSNVDVNQYKIALFSQYFENKTWYYLLKGRKFSLIDKYTQDNINFYNRDQNIVGLGCPNRNEIGFINHGGVYFIPKSTLLYLIHDINKTTSILQRYTVYKGKLKFYFANKDFLLLSYDESNQEVSYKNNIQLYTLGDDDFSWYVFSNEELNSFIYEFNLSEDYFSCYAEQEVDVDSEGFVTVNEVGNTPINNNLEIVVTAMYDDLNEYVTSYFKYPLVMTTNKFVTTIKFKNYMSFLNSLHINCTKVFLYFRLNPYDDFEQFECIDLINKYNNYNDTFLLSLSKRTGIYLTQTIGYSYNPKDDISTYKPNKKLIIPNDVILINGIQVALNNSNIIFPTVGRGKVLQDVYYDFNIVPDCTGNYLLNVSNDLGVYNEKLKTLYLLEMRSQENILLFYLKETIPYVINNYKNVIYTPIGVIILTNKGIVIVNGNGSILLSEAINNYIENEYKKLNIFYDDYNQELHIIGDKWYRYDFSNKVWNEFSFPIIENNNIQTLIKPEKLININDKYYILFSNKLYEYVYDNNGYGYLKFSDYQFAENNIMIKLNNFKEDILVNDKRTILTRNVQLNKRVWKSYLDCELNFKSKLFSIELEVEIAQISSYRTKEY